METKKSTTIITILLLIFLFPIGLIIMLAFTNWKTGIKILITIIGPIVIILGVILSASILVALNPQAQIQKANCMTSCNETYSKTDVGYSECVNSCASPEITNNSTTYPLEIKNSLISNCVEGGAPIEACTCIVNHVESKINWEELSPNLETSSEEFSNSFDSAMLEGVELCK
jgi:hypothetical protein